MKTRDRTCHDRRYSGRGDGEDMLKQTLKYLLMTTLAVMASTAWPSAERFLEINRCNGNTIRSKGRSVRYFADHDLAEKDTEAQFAVVVVHGVDGGTSDASQVLRHILGNHPLAPKVFFVAPCFPIPSMLNEAERKRIVYWDDGRWQAGHDSPVAQNLCPYDVLDFIFYQLNDNTKYPNLKRIVFCGYSAGAQVISRYMAASRIKAHAGLSVDFAAGAPSSWLFLDKRVEWHYGLSCRCRYAAKIHDKAILGNIKKRHLLCFCGTKDTGDKHMSTTPRAMAQGANRYERFKNFQKHISAIKAIRDSFDFVAVDNAGHSLSCWQGINLERFVFGQHSANSGQGQPSGALPHTEANGKYGSSWQKVAPEACGFNGRTLAQIPQLVKDRNMGTTGLMIVVGGKEMYSYGDVSEVSYIASCRKSVLSMMYGKYVHNGTIDLDATVDELGIDDIGGLLPAEKRATVRDLISARSGCYHPAANDGGIPDGNALERGTTEPGTRFVYNNWDFNVAGTVFEMQTGKSIYDIFDREFAKPLQLQDWSRSSHRRTGDSSKSRHLAYHFHLSTRDMARLGELMLRKGVWNGRQLVPPEWIEESTSPVSSFPNGGGYGYMWWIESDSQHPELCRRAFSAHGMYGQRISVFPALDMVVAHKSARNKAHPTTGKDYWNLIRLIFTAYEGRKADLE